MKKWEYKHYNCRLIEEELNDLGDDGWELVSHTAVAAMGQYYVFKREKTTML